MERLVKVYTWSWDCQQQGTLILINRLDVNSLYCFIHFVRTIFANQVQLYIIIKTALKPTRKILKENYFTRQRKGATQTPDSANFR